ncbi:MAG: Ig-like domain repeat protein, partial [Acidobacteria bacterium]|nr:Ig-like domain repeat protein [Acidobacteriota bacterium]
MRTHLCALGVYFLGVFLSVFAAAQQVATRPLIAQPIDETQLITLRGNTHPLAQPQFDLGTAPPALLLNRMLLVLKRSPQQEYALRKLLDDQQDKASPSYHKWLTPDRFGTAFGAADQDVQTVTNWLQSHGLQVNRVSRGKTIIEFSGAESQVEAAFNTQIHQYLVNGEYHWANASDPSIPAALVPAVAGVRSLNNFSVQHFSHVAGVFSRNESNGQITPMQPQMTLGGQCGVQQSCYGVGPYDFATIYDILNSWNAASPIDGTGQTIAIVGESDINPQDVADFRNYFGLPAYGQPGGPALNIIHNGPAPGILTDGEETESDLDVEWSGAVAKGASIDFVVAQTTETTQGIDLSALYIIDNNLAPVMSESYGACEMQVGTSGNQFFSTLWEQAAAQGITVMLSAGDGSSAGCDNFGVGGPATLGLAVSGFASTPFNVAVGGTDFYDLTNAATYWNPTNATTTHASAKSYIPETTWDNTCTNPVFGTLLGFSNNAEANCNNFQLINAGFVNIVGGSGGRSSCISSDGVNPSSCSGGYAKPSWQNAPGVPGDNVRDVPDVSLYAASGSPSGSFYIVCEADAVHGAPSCVPNNNSTHFIGVGGTSASSPAFAGIMALVNQKMQTPQGQGNANFVLYKLAQQHPTVFHDVTTGTIEVPCQSGSPNCTVSNPGDQYGILNGYNTATGYDLATGIGSVDVGQLLQDWSLASFRPSLTSLTLSPTTGITHGQSVNVTATVTPSTGAGTPTGDVSLLTSTGVPVDGFRLANGQISGSTKLLPGGTYTVTAHYAGDSVFGGSDSPIVNMTVGKENSSSKIELVTFDWQGHLISPNSATAVYGSPYLLRADVLNSAGSDCLANNGLPQFGCPTGSLIFTDNGNPLTGTFALNSLGYTEDKSVQLPGGNNSVVAQYLGDSSYNVSSTATTLSIMPAATITTGNFYNSAVGQIYQPYASVQAQSLGVVPAGTVTFYSNGNPIPGTVTYAWLTIPGSPGLPPTVTLSASLTSSSSPFPAPGNYTLTARYSGDGNYQASTSSGTTLNI